MTFWSDGGLEKFFSRKKNFSYLAESKYCGTNENFASIA
jgi:hypothetical protein